MTAAPVPVPVDARIKAALDELAAAAEQQQRESEFVMYRPSVIESVRRGWDTIEPHDERWLAINALLMLDQESCHAGQVPLPALVAMHENLVGLGVALLDIDADLGEGDIRWLHMRQLRAAVDALPALYAALEDALAASQVRA